MPIERERKYLVRGDDWRPEALPGRRIAQGYVAMSPTHHVRVRLAGPDAFITVKSRRTGGGRFEFEYPIPSEHARELLSQLDALTVIDKVRHDVPLGRHTIQVDVFHGRNSGLVMAEIELDSADDPGPSPLPPWLGDEVTHDDRYYNSYLSRHAYSEWG